LAHSDSFAAKLQPEVWRIEDRKILVPWKNDTRAPLTKEATETFLSLLTRMRDRVMSERMRLEPELKDYFNEIPMEQVLEGETRYENG
jgi:hypothetical protein